MLDMKSKLDCLHSFFFHYWNKSYRLQTKNKSIIDRQVVPLNFSLYPPKFFFIASSAKFMADNSYSKVGIKN